MTTRTRSLTRALASLVASWMLLAACTGYNPPKPYAPQEPSPTPVGSPRIASDPLTLTPTTTPVPLETQAPLAEPTPLPTEILPPTSTLTENTGPVLGEPQNVSDGGFSFRPVVGYDVNINTGTATLVSQDGRFIFTLAGGRTLIGTPLDSILSRLLENVSEEMDDFESSEPYPITIGESQGLATDVAGKMAFEVAGKKAEAPINGEMAVVAPNTTQVFYVLAFAVSPADQNLWETSGEQAFTAMIDSVSFFEPSK